MKRKSVGERINIFDHDTECTVMDFNGLFPECPLPNDFELDQSVEIGEYIGADRRLIIMGNMTFPHKMFKDMLYGIDRDAFYEPDKDEPLNDIMGHPV